jgi:hypothetical protein
MVAHKAELKARLEKALRRPILQAIFDKFDGYGSPVEAYFEGGLEHGGEKENFQALKGIFAAELDHYKACRLEEERTKRRATVTGPEEATTEIEMEPSHGSYMSKRAEVISEVWAGLADRRPDVTEFRQTVLGGSLRSPEEASSIVDALEDTLGEFRALELGKLGSILANDYYGWDEEGAVWYVLTGRAPLLHPIRMHARGKPPVPDIVPHQFDVTLSVLPWVHAQEVEHAYRTAQRKLLEEPPRKTAPRTSPRVLEVVQFWWKEQFRTSGNRLSWPALCELWNQKHPDKTFSKWRTFREYFFRGTKEAQPRYVRFPQPDSLANGQDTFTSEEYMVNAVQSYRSIGDRYTAITWGHERSEDREHRDTTAARDNESPMLSKPTKTDNDLQILGNDSYGWPIFADKWYLLHENGYTGTFESREEAEADSRRTPTTEVLTSAQLLARLEERETSELENDDDA